MAKYGTAIVEKICGLISSDDYTVEEICKRVGITRTTYFEWKSTKTDFSDALKKAEEARLETFKSAARRGMLMLLQGKEYEEVTTEYTEDKQGKPKVKSMKKVKKFYMPNAASVIFTMKNLDKENFADLIKTEHSGGISGEFLHFLKQTSTETPPGDK